jgi:hypothetical protein
MIGRDEVHAERPEGDPRSFDHESWLLLHVDTSCCGTALGLPATSYARAAKLAPVTHPRPSAFKTS